MTDTPVTHTLTRHRDIQAWVSDRKGLPAIRRVPDSTGSVRARLAIRFANRAAPSAKPAPSIDDGMMPVSWTAWLAELDRQGLALKVINQEQFEFVERKDLH
jgi:hypothetical protein